MRTDIHRPSAINPAEYEFVAFKYIGPDMSFELCDAVLSARAIFNAHKQDHPGADYARTEHAGSCYVCGASAFYLNIYYHPATNRYIETGNDCARKLDMSSGDSNAFRRAIANAREAQAGKRKAIAILGDLGLMEAWEVYIAEPVRHPAECELMFMGSRCTCGLGDIYNRFEERTIRDIVGKLVRYGSVSDNQVKFVRNLLDKIIQRPIIAAQRQAEKDAAGPVPTGRVEMIGEVVGIKEVEAFRASYYAPETQIKLIIKLENGSKVYGNRFANLDKGSKIKFVASVEPSKDDPKFGFYKRPKLVEDLTPVEVIQ